MSSSSELPIFPLISEQRWIIIIINTVLCVCAYGAKLNWMVIGACVGMRRQSSLTSEMMQLTSCCEREQMNLIAGDWAMVLQMHHRFHANWKMQVIGSLSERSSLIDSALSLVQYAFSFLQPQEGLDESKVPGEGESWDMLGFSPRLVGL